MPRVFVKDAASLWQTFSDCQSLTSQTFVCYAKASSIGIAAPHSDLVLNQHPKLRLVNIRLYTHKRHQ